MNNLNLNSFWNQALGKFMPDSNLVGFDFISLFKNPLLAELVYYHEIAHSVLMNTTEFGMATMSLHANLPFIDSISFEKRNEIEKNIYNAQILTQEGSATLMQILRLKTKTNRKNARIWAKTNLSKSYYGWFIGLDFVLEMSAKYRNLFTATIPHIAMHNGFREIITNERLLDDPQKFNNYIVSWDDKPDIRFKKLIEIIKLKPQILKTSSESICAEAGINFYPDTSKATVAAYLNYLEQLKGSSFLYRESDISHPIDGVKSVLRANQTIIVSNMNLNFVETGTPPLLNKEDLLHYADVIKAIMLFELRPDARYVKYLEQTLNRKIEFSMVGFLKTPEKYNFPTDLSLLSELMNNQFKEHTLLVKFVFYNPHSINGLYFESIRKPDVVIHNSIQSIAENLNINNIKSSKLQYVYIRFGRHPFKILVIKDHLEILHILSAYGNVGIESYLKENRSILIECDHKTLIRDPKHFNNACSIWLGIDWDMDFYNTLFEGKTILRND